MYEMCCINKCALPYNEMYYIINLDIVCEHTLTFKSMGSASLKNKQTNKQIVPYSKQGCLYLLKHSKNSDTVKYYCNEKKYIYIKKKYSCDFQQWSQQF